MVRIFHTDPLMPVAVRAQLEDADKAWVQQADVYNIIARVYDAQAEDPETPVTARTLAIDDVIFDTPTDDAAWEEDTTGYTFKWTADPSWFPLAGRVYPLRIDVTVDSGSDLVQLTPIRIQVDVHTDGAELA